MHLHDNGSDNRVNPEGVDTDLVCDEWREEINDLASRSNAGLQGRRSVQRAAGHCAVGHQDTHIDG